MRLRWRFFQVAVTLAALTFVVAFGMSVYRHDHRPKQAAAPLIDCGDGRGSQPVISCPLVGAS